MIFFKNNKEERLLSIKINATSRGYLSLKNKTSQGFKAQVAIIPSSTEPGQPNEDKFILQCATEEIKEELQSEFSDKETIL